MEAQFWEAKKPKVLFYLVFLESCTVLLFLLVDVIHGVTLLWPQKLSSISWQHLCYSDQPRGHALLHTATSGLTCSQCDVVSWSASIRCSLTGRWARRFAAAAACVRLISCLVAVSSSHSYTIPLSGGDTKIESKIFLVQFYSLSNHFPSSGQLLYPLWWEHYLLRCQNVPCHATKKNN